MSKIDESQIPVWDLEKVFGYKNLFDPKYDSDLEAAASKWAAFRDTFAGHLDQSLAEALPQYNAIIEYAGVLSESLRSAKTVDDTDANVTRESSLLTKLNELLAKHTTFFELELCSLEDDCIQEQLKDGSLTKFEPFIHRTRQQKPHQLSRAVEEALSLRSTYYGPDPVVEYFIQQLTRARFLFVNPLSKVEALMDESQLLDQVRHIEPEIRQCAMRTFNNGLKINGINRFAALSLNIVSGQRTIENKERHYESLRHYRNLDNQTSNAVVASLLHAVRTRGVELGKRYYQLKKRLLQKTQGIKEFTWADRIAPLNFGDAPERLYEWSECLEICRTAFNSFSPKIAEMFDWLVQENRIDARNRPGKRSGACCFLGAKTPGPILISNYFGKAECVATIAHEAGHAIHAMHACNEQPYILTVPGMAIAEVASTFGEQIVFADLLQKSEDDRDRLRLLCNKLDDLMGCIVRQCSFDRFEELVHEARKGGVVPDDAFCNFWMQATKEFYGREGEVFDSYRDVEYLWAYVPHFHHTPFYVYGYSFAVLVVGAISRVLSQKLLPDFAETYSRFLSAGSSVPFVGLMKMFGLDGEDEKFWIDAIDAQMLPLLEQAEELAAKLQLQI